MKHHNKSLVIILVKPQMGENIGSAARVMHNFSISDLRIISPRDGWPNEKALVMAAGGSHIVKNAATFDNLADAMLDIELVYAVSARKRDMVKDIFYPEQVMKEIDIITGGCNVGGDVADSKKVAFVFGQENSGLTNKDISLCNAIVTIPVNPDYPSLNLAQSVSILCYEYFKYKCSEDSFVHNKIGNNTEKSGRAKDFASKKDIAYFVDDLVSELEKKDFYKSPDMKPTMIINLTNIFSRNLLTKQELASLMGIVKCLSKY